jgi:hypothetical protein
MKLKFFFTLMMLSSLFTLRSQQITVALHHKGATTMFYGNNALSDANTTAQDGDTIYLPGKAHYPGINISKKLVIIGAGHTPDSTTATGRTLIESDITFLAGSDGSVIEGIYSDRSIYFELNTRINDVKIRRSNVNSIYFNDNFDTTHTCKRVLIEQNVIRGEIYCYNADYLIIRNNFIRYRITSVTQNALIENNIFYYQVEGWNGNNYILYDVYNSLVRNNIFILPASHSDCYIIGSNNDVMNNIFPTLATECSSSNYEDNYSNVATDNIFVGQTSIYTGFDYSHNYHLKTPELYPGFANMGVGVYGGTLPFKDGAVPFNPHIVQKDIAPSTDNNGNLNINIKVKAQNN